MNVAGLPRLSFLPLAATFPERVRFRRLSIVVVALVAGLAFANAVANGFVLDDKGIIVHNPLVTSGHGVWAAFAHPYWPESVGGGQYRPLGVASFALDWLIAGGNAHWFHAVNVLWHVAATLLVFALAAELLAPAAALAAALLFAVHPVHVEAVANTVGRLELMTAVWVLAALLAHRRGSRLAPAFYALALLSKENAVVFLALALASDRLLSTKWRETLRERRWLYAAYAGVSVAYAILLAVVFRHGSLRSPVPALVGVSVGDRLLTVLTVMPQYVRLLLFPASLSADYQPQVIQVVHGLTLEGTLGLFLLLALTAAIVRAWRSAPEVAFGLLWIPITLLPVSNIFFVSGVLLGERNLYLPSVGLVIVLGWLVERAAREHQEAVVGSVAVLALLGGVRSAVRTPAWHDSRAFALTILADRPESYWAHWMAGQVYAGASDWPHAKHELAIARQLFDRDPHLLHESAEIALEQHDFAAAAAMLDSALLLRPADGALALRLADVRYRQGDPRGAIAAAQRALRLAPDSVRAGIVIGEAARQIADTALALATYRELVATHPAVWELHVGYADVLLAAGDSAAALHHAQRAVELSGNAAPATRMRDRVMHRSP